MVQVKKKNVTSDIVPVAAAAAADAADAATTKHVTAAATSSVATVAPVHLMLAAAQEARIKIYLGLTSPSNEAWGHMGFANFSGNVTATAYYKVRIAMTSQPRNHCVLKARPVLH